MSTIEADSSAGNSTLRRAWSDLRTRGYTVVTDADLGMPAGFREHLAKEYFSPEVLEADIPEIHQDRDRARDVIRYDWTDGRIELAEHDTVELSDRSGFNGKRSHARVEVLRDAAMREWVSAVLSLVPEEQRQERGTFGLNLFRTRKKVVSGPHKDDEEFCVVYVVDKHGGGAQTQLHDPKTREVVKRVTLEPGDLIIFRDEMYLHNVTPLEPVDDDETRRDAVVCTVNYPTTYALN
jgi:hypothetical protein